MKAVKAVCGVEDRFANNDIAIEILSRLPTESIPEFRCVCKRWDALSSNPDFISAHFQRSSRTISGLLVQGVSYCSCCKRYYDHSAIHYISVEKDGRHRTRTKIFEFLPEKVRVLASCNGVVLCRNILEELRIHYMSEDNKDRPKKVVLYVCNPFTNEWTSLKPAGRYRTGCCFGLAYDPYGSSSVVPTSSFFSFEVVLVQRPLKHGKDPYRFKIYSTKTRRWRICKEACKLSHRLYLHQGCYASGVFYWLTTGHSVLAFDLKQEKSLVIELPGYRMRVDGEVGTCLGVSNGKMHYICFNAIELLIWVLEHDKWVLKYTKAMGEMRHRLVDNVIGAQVRSVENYKRPNGYMKPFAFQDDILFLKIGWSMCTYDIKTGIIEELGSFKVLGCVNTLTVIPYSKSLLQVHAQGSTKRPS